ncbi:MAG: filamentous hemagglutinin N-terminal domain-containing protein [Caulobacteraceae bacterium]|nr:filamentous hemagglutinin N-terminal domain-containing protein [Caulobacteraceae bacterium]
MSWAIGTAAMALPSNPTIFASSPLPGSPATFNTVGNTLTVTQNAERVVIDWDSFNISNIETVTFAQGGQDFIAFNRIDPGQLTTIDGILNANGSVWLFSPGGILFGPTAQVNAGSFFAGLGELTDPEATAVASPSQTTVHVYWGLTENNNVLSVLPGAQILTTNGGFVALQASHMDIGGDIGGTGAQVGYIVSEGGSISIVASGSGGWAATDFNQASDNVGLRENPYFNHTGTTNGAWIELEAAFFTESNWETVINLDGVMSATGSKPGGAGVSIWGGRDSTAPSANGHTATINVDGSISSTALISFTADDIVVSGDLSGSGDIDLFAYDDITVAVPGIVDSSGGHVLAHGHGDDSTVAVYGSINAGTAIDLWSTSAGTQTIVAGSLRADGTINIRSGGDVAIQDGAYLLGDADNNSSSTALGVAITAGAGLAVPANTYYVSSGDLLIQDGTTILGGTSGDRDQVILVANGGSLDAYGTVEASRAVLRANGQITVGGEIYATNDINILGWTQANPNSGSGITVTSGAVLSADNRLLAIAHYGDILIQGGATLTADADNTPTDDIFGPSNLPDNLIIYSFDQIEIEAGATLNGGASTVALVTKGTDSGSTLADAALIMDGDIQAEAAFLYAYEGSVVISGTVTAGERIDSYAAEAFVLTDTGSLTANGVSYGEFPVLEEGDFAGVLIHASDIAVAGEVYAQSIAVVSLNGSGVVLGGDDLPANVGAYELGGELNLSNDEFQHLHGEAIVIVAGSDSADPFPTPHGDMTVQDLTISPDVLILTLGASSTDQINITGVMTPQGPDTALWIGFVSQNPELATRTGAIPGTITITGSIGTESNPFAEAHLLATDNIFMGSQAFITAAAADEDFDADHPGDLPVEEGHVFIASNVLTLGAKGRIIQQNTGADGAFAGLLIGEPQAGTELISADAGLDGAVIGGPNGYTISLSSGPTKIQLYGVLVGQTGQVTGKDVADNPYLLSPLLPESVEYTINGCQFGGGPCGDADKVPHFETPTDVGVDDLAAIEEDQQMADDPPADEEQAAADDEDDADDQAAESDDQDSELLRALVAPGADRAYQQERIGEPITGSGNEDLWTGSGAGDRP